VRKHWLEEGETGDERFTEQDIRRGKISWRTGDRGGKLDCSRGEETFVKDQGTRGENIHWGTGKRGTGII
jgi:hypothetical protein